ncbi:MAG: prevent-host-death protein [Daejeonella sp.]|nr:prevent-host-death protein [Daejeonella sp.]
MEHYKKHFDKVLKRILTSQDTGISFAEKTEIIARLSGTSAIEKTKRKLGILEGKSKAVFADDFKISEDDFLGL